MKRILLLTAAMLALAGCHAVSQVPPNPTVNTCPPSNGSAYSAISGSTTAPLAATTVTDTKPVAGTYCYIVQSAIPSTAQVSVPSNTAGPYTTSGSNSVLLTWNAPTSGPTPTGYIILRAPAVSSTLLAPALGNGSVAETNPLTTTPVLQGYANRAINAVLSLNNLNGTLTR
jgi:hypothetical protein